MAGAVDVVVQREVPQEQVRLRVAALGRRAQQVPARVPVAGLRAQQPEEHRRLGHPGPRDLVQQSAPGLGVALPQRPYARVERPAQRSAVRREAVLRKLAEFEDSPSSTAA
ncbi:hypothetical protein ACIO3O_13070 [Streptomyces sp. NPDC087440]|uniref:hypothetical protein n=1 Tax=Streptomyces sp. NPDC087440 TaxID=3365790 RepID=UPI0038114077